MLNAIIYVALFYIINKFIPNVKLENGSWDPYIFIPALSLSLGLIEGLITYIASRKAIFLFLAPIYHLIINVCTWHVCKMLPWTKNIDGSPSEYGYLIVVVVFSIALSTMLESLKKN